MISDGDSIRCERVGEKNGQGEREGCLSSMEKQESYHSHFLPVESFLELLVGEASAREQCIRGGRRVETSGMTRISKARRKRERERERECARARVKERKSGREDEWRRGSSTI